MTIIVGLALALVIGGLVICYVSGSAGRLAGLFWWAGIALAVVGLVLLVTPVLLWVNLQLRAALGQP